MLNTFSQVLEWHRMSASAPQFHGYFLVAMEEQIRGSGEEPAWLCQEAQFFGGQWTLSDGDVPVDASDIVWWCDVPIIKKGDK